MAYRRAQLAFTGGELGEEMYSRVDVEEFGVGLKTAYNVLILKRGGAVGRAGTEHICRLPDSAYAHRLTGFEFNTEQTYVNAWGNQVMYVIKDGALVLEDSQNIGSITQAAEGVVTVATHGFLDGEMIYASGISGMTQLNARYFYVSDKTANTFKIKDIYGAYVDTSSMAAASGGVVARVVKVVSPYTSNADPNAASAQVFYMDLAQSNDEAYIAHLSIAPQILTRTDHDAWTVAAQTIATTLAAPAGVTATATTGTGGITYRYVVTAVNDATGEESVASTSDDCTNDLSADPTYKNTITYSAATNATRYNIYKEENGIYGFIGGTTGLTFVDGPGGSAGGEITPDLSVTPPLNNNPFSGVGYYPACVEMHEARLVYGQLDTNPGALFASQPTRFSNFNYSVPQRSDDTVSARLLPGVNPIQGMCSLGDVLFCATGNGEFTVSGSGVVNYMTPASATPRVWDRVGADRLKPLLVGGYALFIQKQGKSIYAFGPSDTNPNKYVATDLTVLAPHLLEDHYVVDWCYQQDPLGIVWIVRSDGALLALTFLPQFKIFAFSRVKLAGSDAGAAVVESCCAISGPNEDQVYLEVKRTINGATCRDVEMIRSLSWGTDVADYWGLDNARRYEGAATSTFDQLQHLEGETEVAALADGFLVTGLTCTNGRVTLPSSFPSGASKVLIGLLPDDPEIEPLPVAQPDGRSAGKRKKVIGVALKLKRSCGVYAGSNADTLHPLKLRKASLPAATPTPPFSGDIHSTFNGKHGKDGTFLIRGTAGLPMHITSFKADLEDTKSNVRLTDADA